MDKGQQFVDDILTHYASKYYDPVKAHEYYMRTRKLAAEREKTALTSDKQRIAFASASEQIAKAREAESETITEEAKSKIEELRKTAEVSSKKISDMIEKLAKDTRANLREVKVNEIPADASPKLRAFLENQNRNIRARATNAAQKEFGDTAGQASRDRVNISRELQKTVSKARDDYAVAIKEMKARYVADTETEKANIRKYIK